MKSENKWEMHRAGFFGYWNYGFREFIFRDGNLLLFGANGTGKSITMQALFPLLLDADFRSERLDANRKKGKLIDHYVLGFGPFKKDSNISYVFQEFIKPSEPGQYLTICYSLDMSIHRTSKKFFGFLLKGPVRIFSEQHSPAGAVRLFRRDESGTRSMKAIGHPDLAKKLAELKTEMQGRAEIRFADKECDYARMINDVVFGYYNREEYENLINIILSIRAPRSGDSDGAGEKGREKQVNMVNTALSESLTPLSEDHFEELANLLLGLDERREELASLQDQCNVITSLKNIYDKYSASMVLDAVNKFESYSQEGAQHAKDLGRKRASMERKAAEYDLAVQDNLSTQAKIKDLRGQLTALRESDANKNVLKLAKVKQDLDSLRDEEKRKSKRIKEIESSIEKEKAEIDETEGKIEDSLEAAESAIKDAQYVAKNNNLWYITAPEACATLRQITAHLQAIDEELARVNDIARHAIEIRNLEASRAKTNQALEEERGKARIIVSKMNNCDDDLEAKRGQWLDEFSAWKTLASEAMGLTKEDSEQIAGYMNALYFAPSRNEIPNLDDLPYQEANKVVRNRRELFLRNNAVEQNKVETAKKSLEDSRADIQKELSETQKQKDVPIKVCPEIQETHDWLKANGVPHAFAYELIDFIDGVSDDDKMAIENAMLQSGILDAVFIPEAEYVGLPKDMPVKLLAKPKCTIASRPSRTLEAVLPEHLGKYSSEITSIINALAPCNENGIFAVSNPFFCHGLVAGHVWRDPVKYIGAVARQQAWEQKIATLEGKIREVNQQIRYEQEKLVSLDEAKRAAEYIYCEFPVIDELTKTFKVLKTLFAEQKGIVDSIERLEKQHDQELEQYRLKIDTFERSWPSWAKLVTFEFASSWDRAYAYITEQPKMLSEYKNYISFSQKDLIDHANAEVALEKHESLRKNYAQQLEDVTSDRDIIRDKIGNLVGQETQLSRLIQEAGLMDIAEQIVEMDSKLRAFETELPNISKAVGEKETELKNVTEMVKGLEMKAASYKSLLTTAEHVVKDILALYLPALHAATLEEVKNTCISMEGDKDAIGDFLNELVLGYENYRNTYGYGSLISEKRNAYAHVYVLNDEFKEKYEVLHRGFTNLRYMFAKNVNGLPISVQAFAEDKLQACNDLSGLIDSQDEEMFYRIFAEGMEHEIQAKIKDGMAWTAAINDLLGKIVMSTHNTMFKIEWGPDERKSKNKDNDKLGDVVDIIMKRALMAEVDYEQLKQFFRSKLETVREIVRDDKTKTYKEALIDVFDYRKWFTFHLKYKSDHTGGNWDILTQNAYTKLSGGEKALATYQPLFAALSARFDAAQKKDCPRFVVMDEAFTVVDANNTNECFKLLKELGIKYIINSQVIDGAYSEIPSLAIYHFTPGKGKTVPILRYEWDGTKKIYPEAVKNGKILSSPADVIQTEALFESLG